MFSQFFYLFKVWKRTYLFDNRLQHFRIHQFFENWALVKHTYIDQKDISLCTNKRVFCVCVYRKDISLLPCFGVLVEWGVAPGTSVAWGSLQRVVSPSHEKTPGRIVVDWLDWRDLNRNPDWKQNETNYVRKSNLRKVELKQLLN